MLYGASIIHHLEERRETLWDKPADWFEIRKILPSNGGEGFVGASETVFQSWLHKITVIEPFFNGLSPFSTIFHGAPYKINSQTNLKFIHGNAAPN